MCWSGPTCEDDYDYCAQDALCPLHSSCEDVPLDEHLDNPTGPGYTCTGCPEGYELTIDFNDNNATKCAGAGSSNCPDKFVNIKWINFVCIRVLFISLDVNECNTTANTCEQQCINTDGGFMCGCWIGYNPLNSTHCEGESTPKHYDVHRYSVGPIYSPGSNLFHTFFLIIYSVFIFKSIL